MAGAKGVPCESVLRERFAAQKEWMAKYEKEEMERAARKVILRQECRHRFLPRNRLVAFIKKFKYKVFKLFYEGEIKMLIHYTFVQIHLAYSSPKSNGFA